MQWRRVMEPDRVDSGDEAQRSGEDSELEGDGGVRCCNVNGSENHPHRQQNLVRSLAIVFVPFVIVFVTFSFAVLLAWGRNSLVETPKGVLVRARREAGRRRCDLPEGHQNEDHDKEVWTWPSLLSVVPSLPNVSLGLCYTVKQASLMSRDGCER